MSSIFSGMPCIPAPVLHPHFGQALEKKGSGLLAVNAAVEKYDIPYQMLYETAKKIYGRIYEPVNTFLIDGT